MARATQTIASTYFSTFSPLSIVQSRNFDAIVVNGINRGKRWNGTTATADEFGITPPRAGPTATSSAGATSYYLGYRYVDRDRATPSSLSSLRTVAGQSGANWTWSSIIQSSQARITYLEFYRTTAGQSTATYPVFQAGIVKTVSAGGVANDDGYAKFTTSAAHGYRVGDYVVMSAFATATEYNAVMGLITKIDSTTTFTTNIGYSRGDAGTGTATQRVFQFGDAGSVTSAADSGGKIQLNLGPNPHNLSGVSTTLGSRITVTGAVGAGAASTNAQHHITAVSFDGTNYLATTDTNFVSATIGGAAVWTYTGLVEAITDADIDDNEALPILNPDGSVNARRFEPPPTFKAVGAFFQDRLWLGVDILYTEGTVATNNTNQTVTGSGTGFTADMVGRRIWIDGEIESFLITSRSSATSITIEKFPANTASGKSYIIAPSPDERNRLYFSEVDEPESVPPTNTITIQENTGDNDQITGLLPHGSNLFVFKNRHTYRLSFARQPRIDGNVSLAWSRGALNDRCAVTWADIAFVMDQAGVYAVPLVGQSGLTNISQPIQNLFRDGTIYWPASKWFFAVADYEKWTVKFFVTYTADATAFNSNLPTRCLTYNIATKSWDPEEYQQPWGGASVAEISGRTRVLIGGLDDRVWVMNQGLGDGVSTGTAAQAASGSSDTLVSSTSVFTSDHKHCSIAIYEGTGKGQMRRIDVVNSGTSVDIHPDWTTSPDSTSKFIIGGIGWNMKSHQAEYPDARYAPQAFGGMHRGLLVNYGPTTNDSKFNVRAYLNEDTSASQHKQRQDQGDGIVVDILQPADWYANMKRTHAGRGASDKGFKLFPIGGGRGDAAGQADKFVAYELQGIGGLDEVEFYQLTNYGVPGE